MSEKRSTVLTLSLGVVLGALLASVICLSGFAIFARGYAQQTAGEKLPEPERISPENQIITANHEAAHAVLDMALLPERGVAMLQVFTKINQGKYWGLTWPGDGKKRGDEAYQHRAIALISLAGGAAEEIFFGRTPPNDDPDADNSAFASLAYCEVAHCACPPGSQVGDQCLLNGEIKPQRELLYAQTKVCVEANKSVIVALANKAILKQEDRTTFARTLTEAELEDFFEHHPLDTDACLEPGSTPIPDMIDAGVPPAAAPPS